MNNISTSFHIQAPLPPSLSSLMNAKDDAINFADVIAKVEQTAKNVADGHLETPELSEKKLKFEQARIKKVGQDFEAIFYSMMLKEMRNSISSEEGGGLFGGEGSDTYGGMFDTFLGQHLATSNQLGIAEAVENSMLQKLRQAAGAGESPNATDNSHQKTGGAETNQPSTEPIL